MRETPLKCPACRDTKGWRSGTAFTSGWSVSCHIAGCATTGDKTHQRWVARILPNFYGKSLTAIAREIEGEVYDALTAGVEDQDRPLTPYELLSSIERGLHMTIRESLVDQFGEANEQWWKQGVPLEIRKTAAQRREEDELPRHAYHYIDLIDFRAILDKQWPILESTLAGAEDLFPAKKEWLRGLLRLNETRKKVMHPLRSSQLEAEDEELLERFYKAVRLISDESQDETVVEEDWKRLLRELTEN